MTDASNKERLKDLHSYNQLDTLPEQEFDDLTRLAAFIFNTPIAIVSLVTDTRQFFKSHHGLTVCETPVEHSFCAHAILQPDKLFTVEDARNDERFKNNPLVTGDPRIIFYAGMPLVSSAGYALGTLGIVDIKPRKLSKEQEEALGALAKQVMQLFELRRTKAQLQQNKADLQKESKSLSNIIEATQVGTWEWDIETGEVKINERYAQMLGYTKKELEPHNIDTWYKVVHPEDRELSDQKIQDCFTKKSENYNIECRLIHKKGHQLWINDRGRVISWSEDGKPLLMAGTHTDITQRKEAESQFKTITNNIPGVVFRYKLNPDGSDELHLVSDGASSIWGISAEEAMKKNELIWERYDERDLRGHLQSIKDSALDESFWQHEWRYHHPDGTLRWHKGSGNPKRLADQSVIWDSVILDITDRKKAETELNDTLIELEERVKEQTCLLNIASLSKHDYGIDELLEKAVEHLPLACQYSEIASAAIQYKGKIYKTASHQKSDWIIENTKSTYDGESLKVSMAYQEEKPASGEGPFMKEEVQLLDSVLDNLVLNINQILARTSNAQIQEALLSSEKHFKALVENGGDAIAIIDLQGNTTYVSPSITRILGYTEEEALQLNLFEIIHPDDLPGIEKKMEEILQNPGVCITGQTSRTKHKDGSWRWLEADITNMLHDPVVNGIVDNFRDVTERIAIEQKIAENEKRYRALVENSGDTVAILTPDGTPTYASPSLTNVLGYNDKEVLDINLVNLVHPDDLEVVGKTMLNALEQPGVPQPPTVARARHKDGRWRYVEAIITNMLHDPAVNGIVDNFRDVTDRIIAQEKIRESEARYRALFETQTSYVIRTDMEGNYTYVNKKFIEEFGWLHSGDDILGKNCMQSISEYDQPKVAQTVAQCIDKPETVIKVDIDKPAKSGGTRHTQWDFVCVVDAEGIPSEIQCLGIDITERIRFEKELLKSNERYKLINMATNEAIYDWNVRKDTFSWGDGFLRIFGHETGETGFGIKDWAELMHPQDRVENNAIWDDFMKDPHQFRWHKEFRFRRKDGEYAYVEEIGNMLRDEKGQPKRMVGVLRDITEARELRQLLDDATKLARVGSWEVELKSDKVYQSPMTLEIHEVGADFTPNLEKSIEFYRKDVQPLITAAVNEAIQNGTPYDLELPLITGKGKERWVRTIGKAEFQDGECVRLYGSFQDIHDRKVTEIRLKNISDNVPGILFQYHIYPDGSDEMKYVSEGSRTIWGLSPEECMADNELVWDGIKKGGEYESVKSSILESGKNLNPWHTRWPYVMPDGGLCYHEGYGNPSKMADGSLVWDSIIMDVTDKQKLLQLAEQTSSMATIGSWELDLTNQDGNRMYWSPTTRQILEVGDDYDSTLTGAFEFYHEQNKDEIHKAVSELVKNGKEFDEELLITTAKNKKRWTRCIGQSDRVKGRCTRIYGSFQDIHRQKMVELELQAAFEEKNNILESIGDAFFAVDRNFIITYWNKEAENLLGRKKTEVLGTNLWESFGDAIGLKFYTEYHKALDTGEIVHFEEYYPATKQWYEVTAYPSPQGLSVYFKDVSLRRTAERQIRQSNERFEKIAEATNDAIWDFNILEDTLFWGQGFTTLFGHDLNKIKPSFDLLVSFIHPDDRAGVVERIGKFMQDPNCTNWFAEYRFLKNDGSYAFVIDRAVFLRDDKGRPRRAVGAMTDITYRIKHESALRKLNDKLEARARELALSNAELEQFAYVASHDLQEPLRMISSFLTQLEKKYSDALDEKGHQYIHYAVDGAMRMRQIILDLLDFSRVGKYEDALEELHLSTITGDVLKLLHRKIERSGARIHIGRLPMVNSYKTPLIQVFQNLIANGIKYVEPGQSPEISINAKELKTEWMISISDNGIGIDSDYFDKIFVIFQRLHVKEEYSGTGMGLAIVKKSIEVLGGRIWLESQKNEGTTFHFTLPKKH